MLTRRDFIQTGAAAGVAAAVIPTGVMAAALPASPALPKLTIANALFDQRLTAGGEFAKVLAETGAKSLSFEGDISPLWRSHLMQQWKTAPTPVAGLTTHGPLFILERMGWKHDMRATYRGQHRINAAGFLEHEIQGPAELIDHLEAHLSAAGADFEAVLARTLQEHPLGAGPQRHITLTTDVRMTLEEELYSYVLAPRCDCSGLKLYSHNHSA